ncbi:phospholipase D-like domain-containing protein [Ruminococcus albus]|uniref:PLD-like domain-containing protein n=1 Tax=Ruminococcus albus TaxID=1264 RepID=A0A1H7LI29_RUMAL|nr:phospholipase D-like domain-containing protein [Ruminococcus albus]SEK98469.1 PLD-like domain-containing protein [Ruminococcus albus]
MSTGNLNLDLFLSEYLESYTHENIKRIEAVKQRYPSLNEKEAKEISDLILSMKEMKSKEKISLAVTAPPTFSIKAKSTKNTVKSMVNGAKKSILITGYSLSEYFNDLIDIIIYKSQTGVFVEFYINDFESQKNVEKINRYKGKFMRVYNYSANNDSMSALHAKVISVDEKKTLITSANLSYHGQEGNIELGTLIESEQIAKQVKDVFVQLVFKKTFVELK